MPKSQNCKKTMLLTKKFSFDAAHRLTNYSGKCKNLHGHTYFLEVTITGEINQKTGMVVDFQIIKNAVEDMVLQKLDHHYINDIIAISTAENIVKWIWDILSKEFKKHNIELFALKLWETPTSYITYQKKI